MKIGITERGDASLDYTWVNAVSSHYVDGAILITKHITDKFIQTVMQLHNTGCRLIIHATCTGWGSTSVEPEVPAFNIQLLQLKKLIDTGFPKSNCVLRVDPIFPTKNGLNRLKTVITLAFTLGLLPDMRIRISVLDEYRHVKNRFIQLGYQPIYTGFSAPASMMQETAHVLNLFDLQYEACAEPALAKLSNKIVETGCISKYDIELMGLSCDTVSENPQNRFGCKCLACKTELLCNKHRCFHKCAYCYWKD